MRTVASFEVLFWCVTFLIAYIWDLSLCVFSAPCVFAEGATDEFLNSFTDDEVPSIIEAVTKVLTKSVETFSYMCK